jgi:hypothetical protein
VKKIKPEFKISRYNDFRTPTFHLAFSAVGPSRYAQEVI